MRELLFFSFNLDYHSSCFTFSMAWPLLLTTAAEFRAGFTSDLLSSTLLPPSPIPVPHTRLTLTLWLFHGQPRPYTFDPHIPIFLPNVQFTRS